MAASLLMGVGAGEGVGVGVGVDVAAGVGEGVSVGVRIGIDVGVGVGVGNGAGSPTQPTAKTLVTISTGSHLKNQSSYGLASAISLGIPGGLPCQVVADTR
jgi:hypothetical protein